MATKKIKFDLPINGIKVKNLDELCDNLTDEIIKLTRSGQLERWLESRDKKDLARKLSIASSSYPGDMELFMEICTMLEVEYHPDDVRAIFNSPNQPGQYVKNARYLELYENLKISSDKVIGELSEEINRIKNESYSWFQMCKKIRVMYEDLENKKIGVKCYVCGTYLIK